MCGRWKEMSLREIKKGIAVPVAGTGFVRWHVPSA
jgi:hypothetical protein